MYIRLPLFNLSKNARFQLESALVKRVIPKIAVPVYISIEENMLTAVRVQSWNVGVLCAPYFAEINRTELGVSFA